MKYNSVNRTNLKKGLLVAPVEKNGGPRGFSSRKGLYDESRNEARNFPPLTQFLYVEK